MGKVQHWETEVISATPEIKTKNCFLEKRNNLQQRQHNQVKEIKHLTRRNTSNSFWGFVHHRNYLQGGDPANGMGCLSQQEHA